MKKRILSCFMALALCLTLLPATALAAEPHTHPICGKTCSHNSDTAPHEDVSFGTALTSSTNKLFADGIEVEKSGIVYKLPAGSYYLADNITISCPVYVEIGTVNLCLNGHTITLQNSREAVFTINNSGATLNLTDCSKSETATIGHNVNPRENGGGVSVTSGTFNMYGGTISGNTATKGGGVGVYRAAKFEMNNSASITDNTANQGGGVYVCLLKIMMGFRVLPSAQPSRVCTAETAPAGKKL